MMIFPGFILACSLAFAVAELPHLHDQASLHTPSDLDSDTFIYPPITARQTFSDECMTRTAKSVVSYVRCPNTTVPFHDSEELFLECGPLIQFGCTFKPSITVPGHLACVPRDNIPAPGTIVCPGDKILFQNIKINELESIRYFIDLRADPLRTDVYILFDATGSMGTAISTAKSRAQTLLNLFSSRPDIAFGVGFYRDEEELDKGFRNAQPITTNLEAVKSAINALKAEDGMDREEANLVALYKIATDSRIGWRTRSRRIIVQFGDQPGHEPSCGSVGRTLDRVIVSEALHKERISLLAVDFGGPRSGSFRFRAGLDSAPTSFGCGFPDSKLAPLGQTSHIVRETGGAIVKSTDQDKLIELVNNLLLAMPREFDYKDTSCEGKVLSHHSPTMPVQLNVGSSMVVTNTLQLRMGVCRESGKFTCQISYTEGGADMKPTEVEFVNILGCSTT